MRRIVGGVLLAGTLLVAACGSRSEDPHQALLAFAQCMREHGVPNFPDPTDDGISLAGTGIDVDSPAFQAAEKACESLLPPPSGRRPGESAWRKVVPGGDCVCADGSEFAFWVLDADPTQVVFYLDGGGACFDATTCAFTGDGESDFYDWSVSNENPGMGGGIFDRARDDNPFAGHSFVYVPLCTGDVYLGGVTREYSPELTVQHKGFVDGTAALKYLAEHYAGAAQVVVLGKTAGSIAAPVYGGLVADLLPDAEVIVFGAQSGAFPSDPRFNTEILGERWGAHANMPDWKVNEGLEARDWGPTRFWIQAGLHDPDIVMARFDYAFDAHAARAVEFLTDIDPTNLVALIDANEAAIEAAGVPLHSYTAPGDGHGILEYDAFYEMEVEGVRLVDWIRALVDGDPPPDVHCDHRAAK